MTDYTAKIKSKGLDGTGFTEPLAAELFNRVGHTITAIVELQVVDKHGPNLKGQRGIELVITQVEPAEDDNLAEHLRELTRTLYFNRGLEGHTGTTTAGDERTVEDVMSSGQRYRPHPFIPVDASQENPICDVCGGIEASAVHSSQEVLDDEGAEPTLDEEDEPHAFISEDDVDSCRLCGRHEDDGEGIHVTDDAAGDSTDGEPATSPPDPWEYGAPEGIQTASTIPDPFQPTP